ncbi:TetR/AcrR family transcriptional regulator [Gordonia soli]|nr:TetR/AcrR family transcriptional regulator [Gordonia soli]
MTAGHVRGSGRGRLLDAAIELIATKGLHALTLRDVAKTAGMSLGSTTYHFADRTLLIGAAVQRYAEDEISRVDAAVEAWDPESGTAEDLVAAMFVELGHSFTQPGSVIAQMEMYLESSRNPELSELSKRLIAAFEKLIVKALTEMGVAEDQAAKRAARVIIYADGLAIQSAARGTPNELPEDAAAAMFTLASTEAP